MPGPQRARLDQALTGAHDDAVQASAAEWQRCVGILQHIASRLETASPEVKREIGGETGPAIDAAFHRSSQGMTAKATDLARGGTALQQAAAAIADARAEQQWLNEHPLTEPAPYVPGPGPRTDDDIAKGAAAKQAQQHYAAAYADQEARAKAKADHMDIVFADSTAVMKDIHKVPDRGPIGDPSSSGGGRGGGGRTPVHHTTPTTGGGDTKDPGATLVNPPVTDHDHHHTTDPGTGGTTDQTGGGHTGTGAPQGGSTIDYPGLTPGGGGVVSTPTGSPGGTGLGLAGAAAGGIGGGLLGTGLATGGIRGGMPLVTNPGTAAGGVRGIGATSRAGVSGALGRSGVTDTGSPATGRGSGARSSGVASGRGSGGRGAAGRGAGGRGASGRGTGSAAGGRGGRKKDEKKGRRDALEILDEDWVDDEEAAPGVLD